MKFFINCTLFLLTFLLFSGCTQQGMVIVDPYFEVLAKAQGVNLKHLAWKHHFAYRVLPEGEFDEILDAARQIVDKHKKNIPNIILSPLLKYYAEELMAADRNVGIFIMQGASFLEDNIFEYSRTITQNGGVAHVLLDRKTVLRTLVEYACFNDRKIMVVYTEDDDIEVFSEIFGEVYSQFFPVKITRDMGNSRIIDEVKLTLGLVKIDDIYLLAEPYNLRIWEELKEYRDFFSNVYAGGIFVKEERVVMFGDNISGQMEILKEGLDEDLEIELFVWDKKRKKLRKETSKEIIRSMSFYKG